MKPKAKANKGRSSRVALELVGLYRDYKDSRVYVFDASVSHFPIDFNEPFFLGEPTFEGFMNWLSEKSKE